ncbi:MAG: hypothetical protein ACTS5F_00695 [Candidatus Hodgkinia cicadicola]
MSKGKLTKVTASTVKTDVAVRTKAIGCTLPRLSADRWAVNNAMTELFLTRGTPLRSLAEVVAWNEPLKEVYQAGNALRSCLWFALLTFEDEVITSESSFATCWEQAMNVGAFAVQIGGRSAPTIMRNILRSVNARTKVVYLALPSAGGETWSAMHVEMLAHALPKRIALVLDLSNAYCVLPDMFNLRGRNFGPNVIVIPPFSRPQMVGIFKQIGSSAALSCKLVAAVNKFIGRLATIDKAPEDRRTRAAFNLFWSVKTICKLRRFKWIICSAGPDGTILHFVKGTPVRLIRTRWEYYQIPFTVSAGGAFIVKFACSELYELIILTFVSMRGVDAVMAARQRKLAPPKGTIGA